MLGDGKKTFSLRYTIKILSPGGPWDFTTRAGSHVINV